jgi:transcriptional regulator with XRE-family HTH domain
MTSDLIANIEARRRLLRMSQQALALEIGMTQGHYSKLLRGRAPLASSAEAKLSAWLEQTDDRGRQQNEESQRLAALIAHHANGLNDAVKALLNRVR